MAHIEKDRKRLASRVTRIRGQVEAIGRALNKDHDCAEVLQTIAACRGAINALMAEVMEGHIRHHIISPEAKPDKEQVSAAEDIIELIRRYLK